MTLSKVSSNLLMEYRISFIEYGKWSSILFHDSVQSAKKASDRPWWVRFTVFSLKYEILHVLTYIASLHVRISLGT